MLEGFFMPGYFVPILDREGRKFELFTPDF